MILFSASPDACSHEMRLPNFSPRRRVELIRQDEAAECGLACVAMIASFYGHQTDLSTLRRRYSTSLRGAALAQVIEIAGGLRLLSRPVRLDVEALGLLRLPCIVHFDLKHFVVLAKVGRNSVSVLDPIAGTKTLRLKEFARRFTGIALELTPGADFEKKNEVRKLSLRTLVGQLPGASGAAMQILLLAGVLQALAVTSPFYMQLVVDSAVVSNDRDLLAVLGIGFLMLALVQVAVTALRSWTVTYLSTALNLQISSNLISHLLRLPITFFAKRNLGEIASRFQSVDVIQRTLATSSIEAAIDGVMAIVTLCVLLYYSPGLTSVVVFAAGMYAVLRFLRYRSFREANEEQITRFARQNNSFFETVRGIQSIKLFGHEIQRRSIWQALMIDTVNSGITIQRLNIAYQALNGVLFGAENVVVTWLGASLVLDGGFSIGMLFAFVAYKQQFISRVANLVDKCIEFQMLSLHTGRISDIALAPPEPREELQEVKREVRVALSLSNVSFRYGEFEPFVLKNISLCIEEGESVAIAGPSGCGKTTLVKIIASLFPPTDGTVMLNGKDIRDFGLAAYRRLIGCVMQDDQLFAGSIAENICFFRPDPDQGQIEQCARLAAMHDDIVRMPMGYNSFVGDMGVALSGGQKQRLLLARALYRQPRILILDEATSHLDVETERVVNAAIQDLKLTRIVIAHRPETIAMAGRVVRLDAGAIAQDLRHVQHVRSDMLSQAVV